MDVPYGKNHDNLTYVDNQTIKMICIKVLSDRIFSLLKHFENISHMTQPFGEQNYFTMSHVPTMIKSDRSL